MVLGGLSREQVAATVAEMLREDPKVSNVVRSGTQVSYHSSSGKTRTLSFKEDYSVDRERSLELVSPIISSDKEYERFLRVVAKVKDSHPSVPVSKAGLHTHVGFKEPRDPELAALTTLWGGIEKKVNDLFHVHQDRTRWARPLPHALTDTDQNITGSNLRHFRDTRYTYDERSPKYQTLNLLPVDRIGTVEFRFANSTLDPVILQAKADLLRNLVRAVRSKKPELVEYLTTTELHQIDLKVLAEKIGANYFLENFEKVSQKTSGENPGWQPRVEQPVRNAPYTRERVACPGCGSYTCQRALRMTAERR